MMKRCTAIAFSCLGMLTMAAFSGAGDLALASEVKPLRTRISERDFPSVFQAWNPADNRVGESELATAARHDLVFHAAGFYGLEWNKECQGLASGFVAGSIPVGLRRRRALLALNPNLVLLMEIRYRDAPGRFLPPDHPWWRRNERGERVLGWKEGGYYVLDFANPDYRDQVATQAAAAVASGVVDGVMLDWWRDDPDRLALITAIRRRIGDRALILVNPNDRKTPLTAPFINGYFMECTRSRTASDWERIAGTLAWAETNLCPPRINCLETWFHESRQDLSLMRATTTLSLTRSDGYCLFSDPNDLPQPDHLHNWYRFWDEPLGRPVAAGARQADGSFRREYSHGTAVYNPVGNQLVAVRFPDPRRSAATGRLGRDHTVPPGDGDLFLKRE